MGTIIKVESLSKAYQLGQFSTGTLSQDISRWWAIKLGKEDPFLKIGELNDRSTKGEKNIVWSLKDVSFEIQQGEAVGIIGKNGAGKSTLLKILSKVTTPTLGSIKLKGRIASLLEVGTGFHPELTGRENIFLNGAILGMRKTEIRKKFDEIVDFSGVERYIDTPVKRYSSGMYVRLAFAVAAHLESEILIVDEVLAVGDAEFQKKCMGKMGEVSKGEGRTVLFVSHNMQMISALCRTSILLKNGCIDGTGPTEAIIGKYLNPELSDVFSLSDYRPQGGKQVEILSLSVEGDKTTVNYNTPLSLILDVKSKSTIALKNLHFSFGLFDLRDRNVCNSCTDEPLELAPGEQKKIRLTLNLNKHLMPGKYKVGLNLLDGHQFKSSYESMDMIYGYPVIEVHSFNSNGGFDDAYKWSQGWGSILYESHIELIK